MCVEENVTSKAQFKLQQQQELEAYESTLAKKGIKMQRMETDKTAKPTDQRQCCKSATIDDCGALQA
jgi:hypothetical protein